MHKVLSLGLVFALAAFGIVSCGGETAVTETATTVGAVVQELKGVGFEAAEPVLLAVEFDDGTEAAVSASASLLDEVGLGADVLNQSPITLVTWGGQYLIFEDSSPDKVVLEESSEGEWIAVSIDN